MWSINRGMPLTGGVSVSATSCSSTPFAPSRVDGSAMNPEVEIWKCAKALCNALWSLPPLGERWLKSPRMIVRHRGLA